MRADGEDKGDKKQMFKYSAESELSTKLLDDLKERVKQNKEKVCSSLWEKWKQTAIRKSDGLVQMLG